MEDSQVTFVLTKERRNLPGQKRKEKDWRGKNKRGVRCNKVRLITFLQRQAKMKERII